MRRLNIEISEELYADLISFIPDRLRRRVVTPLLQQLADALREPRTRQAVLGGLLAGDMNTQTMIVNKQMEQLNDSALTTTQAKLA